MTASVSAFAMRGERFRMVRADAAATRRGQRLRCRVAGEQVPCPRIVEFGTQYALQGRGETGEGVAQPVREPRAIGGEVDVVAVENAQLLQEFVVAGVEPVHLVAPGAAGVGQHERIAAVGLGLTRVEVGGTAHHQTRHVRHRHAAAGGDAEHEPASRAG